MDEALRTRVEQCCRNYENVTGKPFNDFFCPILLSEQSGELCKGHIINDVLETSNAWVPQLAAIDGFYGSVAEADMVAVIQDRGSDPVDVWIDPDKNRRHKPRLECGGKEIRYYFPKPNHEPVPGHARGRIVDDLNNTIRDLALKVSDDEILALEKDGFQIVIDRDYRPHVIASLIKSAHLTLFRMLGYSHVLSAGGKYFASILSEFYTQNRHMRKKDLAEAIDRHFLKFSTVAMPLAMKNEDALAGTVLDNRVLFCCGATRIFAIGVIVQAGRDKFCVFSPADDDAIDTYFSFLNEPPSSIGVRLAKFCPADAGGSERWEVGKDPVLRVQMPHAGGLPDWVEEKFGWKA
jgi:hypothetical protein